MRTCVLTFFGQGDERDEHLGLPVPFYRYLIIASDVLGNSVASVTALFGQGPEPDEIHYLGEDGGVEAAIDAAVAGLSNLPKLKGLQVKRDDGS